MIENKMLLKEAFLRINVSISDTQVDKFISYYQLLIDWNKKINLTAITDFQDVVEKHFLDSVSILNLNVLQNEDRLIDLGTGAGFPGIPLKIIFPDIHIVLADSLKKRINFLNIVIEELKLKNIKTVHGRAEDLARENQYREKFDFCVSRAVANLSLLSEYCIPFVRIGGKFISYKSDQIEEEINESKNAISLLGGNIEDVYKFQLADSNIGRSFVIIRKEKKTNIIYPRRAGIPSKNPLI